MDMHLGDPENLTPPADPRLAAEGYELLAHIAGQDRVLRISERLQLGAATCYGFLARSLADPLQYVAVLRGTNGVPEWIKDANFLPVPHPIVGTVEGGFANVYDTMQLAGHELSLANAIALLLPRGSRIKVIGHSLGSAEATYLTFDLAHLFGAGSTVSVTVSGLFFASPRTGNKTFCTAFEATVGEYQLYNFGRDIVPDVPLGPDYETLARARVMRPDEVQAEIQFDFGAFHHITSYIAELDYPTFLSTTLNDYDRPLALCVRGPSGGLLKTGSASP